MDLLIPDIGLVFWQSVIFLIVFFVLRRYAWTPILSAIKTREFQIEDALRAAENAREEMEQIKMDNEYLIYEAKMERDQMIKDATMVAQKIKDDARDQTSKIADKLIADAKETIESEKNAAIAEVKGMISEMSLEIAEKVIREKLADDKSQRALVDKFIKEAKIN